MAEFAITWFMSEPSVRTSRRAIGSVLLAVLTVGGGFFLGRATAPPPPVPEPVPVVTVPTPTPSPAEVRAALDRGGIIALAQQAADAFASGAAMPAQVSQAAGRRFDVVIPFGCSGPVGDIAGRSSAWQYDAVEETLRASVAPFTWQGMDWGVGNSTAGPAKGFWISRPWSSSSDCPERDTAPVPQGVEAITLTGQTLALMQFFAAGANGEGWREGRPFEVVKRIAPGQIDNRKGLRLRVQGRIESSRNGGPVRCIQPGGMEQRPICAVVVQMEEVRIELPSSGEVLGTWPVDQRR